jgi:hypothetical protein
MEGIYVGKTFLKKSFPHTPFKNFSIKEQEKRYASFSGRCAGGVSGGQSGGLQSAASAYCASLRNPLPRGGGEIL